MIKLEGGLSYTDQNSADMTDESVHAFLVLAHDWYLQIVQRPRIASLSTRCTDQLEVRFLFNTNRIVVSDKSFLDTYF